MIQRPISMHLRKIEKEDEEKEEEEGGGME
jgi:hypothetical protein